MFIYSFWRVADRVRHSLYPCRTLVPWRYAGHSDWIGWGYGQLQTDEGPRKYGVLWQKNPKAFRDSTAPYHRVLHRVLEALQYHRVPLKVTANVPQTLVRSRFWKPGSVEVTGVLQQDDWQQLLRGAAFVLGIGAPVLGPTVTDALFNGCVLMCAKQQVPDSLQNNRNIRCQFDREVVSRSTDELERWIRGSDGVERTALRLIQGDVRFDRSDIPKEYFHKQHRERCLRLLKRV